MAKRSKSKQEEAGQTAVCVIGAGLGGLALAIRLQAAGLATTLIEARAAPGGLVRRIDCQHFQFEEGPALLADRAPFDALFALGANASPGPEWIALDPAWRMLWSDGTALDLPADRAGLARQIARLAPGEEAGLEQWLDWCDQMRREGWRDWSEARLDQPAALARSMPQLAQIRAWQSGWAMTAKHFEEPHLRQALSVPALLSGGNPFASPAPLLAGQYLPGMGPGWWPRGGMAALVDALAAHFTALGGTLRLHDPVVRIHTLGNRASEVECQSGWRIHCRAVASGADLVHTWRDLLRDVPHAAPRAAKLARRRFAPSVLTVHFALAGSWPGIPHSSVLLGARFKELFADLFDHGVLPRDMLVWLHHPTVTEPDLAPPGHSLMRASVPVAHLGKLPVDWEVLGPTLAERVLAEVGRRLIPDIGDRILARAITTPRDLALDLGLHLGSGWGLEPSFTQSGPLRQPLSDRRLPNVYFTGAAVHPGAGVAAVLAGAKNTASCIMGDLR